LGAFGEKLRKQREQRGLELDAISNTTKISPRMLRALEDEHFDQLPGGVFNKGFVRAYARQVGLNEEEAVADYLEALRESQIQQQSILPDFRAPMGHPADPTSSSPRATNHVSSGQFSSPVPSIENHIPAETHRADAAGRDRENNDLDTNHGQADHLDQADRFPDEDGFHHDAVIFPTQGFISGPAIDPAEVVPSAQVPWRKLAAGLFAILVLLAFWNLRRHAHTGPGSSVPPVSAGPSTPSPSTPQVAPQSVSTSPDVVKPNQVESPSVPTSKKEPPAATIKPSVKPSQKLAAMRPAPVPRPTAAKVAVVTKPPKTFTLLIRAEKTTWVSITADGKPVADETLIAPAHTSIRATQEITVKTRNASGISFLLNGREFPVSGGAGDAKTYVFNSFGYHLEP